MTIAWVPVSCPQMGNRALRSGLPRGGGLLGAIGAEVVASEDGEVVSRLSLVSSLIALFLCVLLGSGGSQRGRPLLHSHMKPGGPEASCGARAPTCLSQPCSSVPCTPICQGPCWKSWGVGAKGQWCCRGCWETLPRPFLTCRLWPPTPGGQRGAGVGAPFLEPGFESLLRHSGESHARGHDPACVFSL